MVKVLNRLPVFCALTMLTLFFLFGCTSSPSMIVIKKSDLNGLTFPTLDANKYLYNDGNLLSWKAVTSGSGTDTNTQTAGWTNSSGAYLQDLNMNGNSIINALDLNATRNINLTGAMYFPASGIISVLGASGSMTMQTGAGVGTFFSGGLTDQGNQGGNYILVTSAGANSLINGGHSNRGGDGGTFSIGTGAGGMAGNGTGFTNTGGNAGIFSFVTGNGGDLNGSTGSLGNSAGSGGNFVVALGTGGKLYTAASGSGGSGVGGSGTFTGGAGGAPQITNSIGGNGGSFTFNGGLGGNAAISGSGGTNTGGNGGNFIITGGGGGNAKSQTTNVKGNGGNVYIYGGTGTTTNINGNVYFGINSAGTAIGKVGVGTLTPQNLLEVKGDINASGANGNIYADKNIQAKTNYISADGTVGFTGTCTILGLTNFVVKNGLIVGCT